MKFEGNHFIVGMGMLRMNKSYSSLLKKYFIENDYHSLENDWRIVGKDIRSALLNIDCKAKL